jgi:two-component system phosphate regulon sensor histidine kinase PhoR
LRRGPALWLVAPVAAIFIALGGLALVAEAALGSGWNALVIFLFMSLAMAATAALLVLPRASHLRRATTAAESLAPGGALALPVAVDEFERLAVAVEAAAMRVDRTLGALRQERAQLEALLNASGDATVAVDAGAAVVYLNDAARQLFGARGEGRPFIETVRDHDLNELVAAAVARGERSVRVVAYGPGQRWLQATAVPIEAAGTWAALAIFHDLTEVRSLDSVRRDFISNVSHELRTPLAGIRAAAETLDEGALDDPPAAREFLGHIQRETDRLTQMVEELLELSRIESGAAPLRFAPIDAAALVRETARRFAQQAERAGLTISAQTPDAPLRLMGDDERLERALGNLVSNAIKFTPAPGAVAVIAEAVDGAVALRVRDTGVGIEPEQRARVFERFYKADRGREGGSGTGLGLAIVKHIAQAHAGSVSVESYPGRGATFSIVVPVADAAVEG